MSRTIQDHNGDTVHVDPVNGLLRLNGCPVCRVESRGDSIWLEFRDGDKIRSEIRGTRFIAIPLSEFVKSIESST